MLPGLEQFACQDLAVPAGVMEHVVRVESSFNPLAIGVVGGRLVRQPQTLPEALATVKKLEQQGYNFSLGLSQVNRYNLAQYGLASYEAAFQSCPNLRAGARILAECRERNGGDWGRAFSCYYSGNPVTGFRHGYVQKVFASMRDVEAAGEIDAIRVAGSRKLKHTAASRRPIHETSRAGNPMNLSRAPAMAVLAEPEVPPPDALPEPTPDAPGREADQRDRAFVF